MATIAALLDVTAERGGTATLDRYHGASPRVGQRRAMLVTKSLAEVAEPIRYFQPAADHGIRLSDRHELRCGWRDDLQRLQRTGGGADLAGGDQKIFSRGAQIAVTEQQLDRA